MQKPSFGGLGVCLAAVLLTASLSACNLRVPSPPEESGGLVNVSYYLNDGSDAVQEFSFESGSSEIRFEIPAREGYVFGGLFNAETGGDMIFDANGRAVAVPDGDTPLYARWTALTYTIVFRTEDGDSIVGETRREVAYGSTLAEFPTVTREGHVFNGWLNALGQSVSDGRTPGENYRTFSLDAYPMGEDGEIILTADLSPLEYTITLDYGDGRVETNQTLAWGTPTSRIQFPYEDTGSAEIVSWSMSRTEQQDYADPTVTKDLTFYAIWREYKLLTFHGEGIEDIPVRVYNGVTFRAPVPERGGYSFAGWYSSQSFAGFPEQSIGYYSYYEDFYAKWTLETYTLSFESYGGTGDFTPLTYDCEHTLALPTAEKDHCIFLGWCRNRDLSDSPMTELPLGFYGDVTLYAKYSGVKTSLRLDAGEGQCPTDSFMMEYSAWNRLPVPTLEGYRFSGWFLDDTQVTDGTGKTLTMWPYSEGGMVLTARYERAYTLSVEINDGLGAVVNPGGSYAEGETFDLGLVLSEGWTLESITTSTGAALRAGEAFTMPAGDVTISVTVKPNTYQVTLEVAPDDYLKTNRLSVAMNSAVLLPTPARQEHSFTGWFYEGRQITDEGGNLLDENGWSLAQNVTLTAEFVHDGNTVLFIRNRDDLALLRENPAGSFRLLDDVTVTDWETMDFSGSFDGGGYTISGLTTALFGAVTGTVENLVLDVHIQASDWHTQRYGAAVCDLHAGGVVRNVTVKGEIRYAGYGDLGGVIGYVHDPNTVVMRCVNHASVSVDCNWSAGGVVGAMGAVPSNFSYNQNYGTVSNPTGNAGGIAGWSSAEGVIKNCANYAEKIAGDRAGGIIGCVESHVLTLDGCSTHGAVEGPNTGKYAGFVYSQVVYQNLPAVTVSNAAELMAAVSQSLPGEDIRLTADIDLAEVSWTPVAFAGNLLGGGYTIRNLTVSSSADSVGMFTQLTGRVEDLSLENFRITSTAPSGCARVGALCGEFHGESISGVTLLSGTVKAGISDCGGLVGGLFRGDVKHCVSYADVSAAPDNYSGCVGGIVGYMPGGTISDCASYGVVQGTYRVGGICGTISISGEPYTQNLVSGGAVIGKNYVGGLFGRNEWGRLTVEACTVSADIVCTEEVGRYVGAGSVTYLNLPATTLSSAEDLLAMGLYVREDVFILQNDISLEGCNWVPMDFAATLDGNGYKIIGLTTHLFNTLTGTVKNLVLEDVNLNTDGQELVATLALEMRGTALLEQVTVSGSLKAVNAGNVGGLVAMAYDTSAMRGCVSYLDVDAVIKTGSWTVGGMLGSLDGTVTLADCVNYGDVTGNNNVGGVLGWYDGTNPVTGCVNYGTVTCTQRAGGIVGYARRKVVIDGCGSLGEFGEGSVFGKYVGDGTVVYQNLPVETISTVEELQSIKYNIAEESYRLAADLDMTGKSWTAFALNAKLDGGGHRITGLSLTASTGNLGLFTTVSGSVENLILEGLQIHSTGYDPVWVGGLCEELTGGTLKQITVSGEITVRAGHVGGLVAKMSDGVLEDCVSYVRIQSNMTEQDGSAGGVIGWYAGGSVKNCQNYGKIEKRHYAGGVIGYMTAWDAAHLTNHGEVVGEYDTGGVVGFLSLDRSATMNAHFTNLGKVTGLENAGGIFGRLNATNTSDQTLVLHHLENQGEVNGESCVGGIFGYFRTDASRNYAEPIFTATLGDVRNTGNVTGESYVGGIVGYGMTDTGKSRFVGLTSAAEITGRYYVGGLAGRLDYIVLDHCSNEGSAVTSTGYLIENSEYFTYLGGYVGYGYGLTGCINRLPIRNTQKGSYVGGLAGGITGELHACANHGEVEAPLCDFVGGLAGSARVTDTASFTANQNGGEVSGRRYVGGIVGKFTADSTVDCILSMQDFTNTAKVSGSTESDMPYTGGIIGYLAAQSSRNYAEPCFTVSITNFQNTGDVEGSAYVGGLLGYGSSDTDSSKILDSASAAAVTGDYYVGGLAGLLDTVRLESCSNAGSRITADGSLVQESVYMIYVGGYVGSGYKMTDCHNAADIICTQKGSYVGGLAGYARNAFSKCSNTGNVEAPKCLYVGGIAGYVYVDSAQTFENNVNEGSVKGKQYVGGIAGRVYAFNSDTQILAMNKFRNYGQVTGNADTEDTYVGGIIGHLSADAARNYADPVFKILMAEFQNQGDVSGLSYVGGLMGYGSSDSTESGITDSTSSAAITAEYVVGGLAGRLDGIRMVSCSNAGSSVTAKGYFIDGTVYYTYLGGYVGYGYAVHDCQNEVSLTYEGSVGGSHVGGIAGYLTHTFSSCSNSGEIHAPTCHSVGGLVGAARLSVGGVMEQNRNTGAVTGHDRVGGIVGELCGAGTDDCTLEIKKQNNSGLIMGMEYVGGIAGRVQAQSSRNFASPTFTILASDLNNAGEVQGTRYVGGLGGYMETDSTTSSLTGFQSVGNVVSGSSLSSVTFAEISNFIINH